MSDNLTAPARPKAKSPVRAPDITIEWRANFFRVRGWTSNADKNNVLKGALETAAKGLLRPEGPASADALKAAKLEPGTEFKSYLKCLEAFEQAPDGEAALALKAASAAYLKHYAEHSDKQKKQTNTARKFQACQKTSRDVDLWLGIHDLGNPPWDSATAMKAATMKAELDFASLPPGEQTAQTLEGKGQTPTFWVNRTGTGPDKKDKTYLFKPRTDRSDREGSVPKGGEAAREALTGRAADILNGMTGIDFKVPETHIVQVERQRFQGMTLRSDVVDGDGDGALVGSLQQFARSQGELRENSPAAARGVPAERCQELAILDIVTLHVDRHSGNFMLNGDAAAADLVPIDNGLTFPETPKAMSYMSTTHNALLRLPGSHQSFTPAMLAKIGKINPSALKVALQSELGDIQAVHPTAAKTVADAALEQSRRAAMFLKQAAPQLTPALVQIAIGQYADRLFDPTIRDDAAFAARAAQVIASVAAQRDGLAQYFKMSAVEQMRISDECERLGWDPTMLSPVQLLAVFKSKAQRPPAPKAPATIDKMTDSERAAMHAAFPNVSKTPGTLSVHAWRVLEKLGTPAEIRKIVERAASKASHPEIKSGALNSPEAALDVIRTQNAADALPPVAGDVGKRVIVDLKRDLIKGLAKMLPDPQQTQFRQVADALHAEDALDGLRDRVRGNVWEILMKEYRDLLEKASDLPDGLTKKGALMNLRKCVERMDASLFEARNCLDDAKLALAVT